MNQEYVSNSHDTPRNLGPLDYFRDLIDSDERINFLMKDGTRMVEFGLDMQTPLTIHPLLPKNHVNPQGEHVTAYTATGSVTHQDGESRFQVALRSSEGPGLQTLTMYGDGTSSDMHMFNGSMSEPYFAPLAFETFSDISLRAAGIESGQSERENALRGLDIDLYDTSSVYTLWCELAQEQHGTFSATSIATRQLEDEDGHHVEARLAISDQELPDASQRNLTLEHATLLPELDAEIVYRLELSYQSIVDQPQTASADKRVVSDCERTLVSSRLTSRDKSGTVTALDVNDAAIMKQFQATLEVMLSDY